MSTSEDVDVCVCVPMFTFHARRITTRSPATWRPTVLEAQVTPTQECTPSVKWNDVIITSGFPKTTNVLILNSSPLISSLQKLKKWYFFLFSITWDAALLQRSPNNMLPFRTSYRVGIYISRVLEKYTRSAVVVVFHICPFQWSNLLILLFQISVFSLKASLHWFSQFEGMLIFPTTI